MAENFQCWRCGTPLTGLLLPMSRREECGQCHADQHVCKMCKFYDGRGGCDEERAEHVSDLERANFCDYFAPSTQAFKGQNLDKSAQAKARLAELFGDEPEQSNVSATESDKPTEKPMTPAEIAEQKLRDMLGD